MTMLIGAHGGDGSIVGVLVWLVLPILVASWISRRSKKRHRQPPVPGHRNQR